MASKMTRAEKERRQAAKQNEKAKKKEEAKKGKSKSSSSLNLPKLFDEPKEKKSFAQRFAEDTKKLDIGNKREERAAAKEKKTQVSDRSWRNPMTKTGVSMPDNIDVTRGNSGRTREELERRDSQRELSQMNPDKWMKTSRETVGLKDNEKAGVGLGTIQHSTLNKNAELFSSNWDRIPQGNRVDAAIQIIYTYGINDQNRDMVMSAFDGASTYDKRKIMDAAVQTVGWNDVTYGMKQAVNNAPDAKEALMQQISEDMNVRNGNYLDTFKREASKAVVDQYNLQQKEDKIITDWAKENYGLGEAIKVATLEKGGSLVNGLTDSVAFGVSDLLQIGQQDNVLDGVNPFEGVKNTEGFGNKIARVGTNVLHDLFRLTGINVSLFSKAFLNEREVREITDALTGITDPYYEAVRNNMVALEGSNLSESQKTAVEIYGSVIEQIPSIVMAVVASPAAGLATTGVTAGGKYARSAYEQGATLEEAVRFGLAGAATEVATEKMFTGFGYFGKGAASKVLNETTKKMLQQSAFPNSMSARILKRVVAGGGEASEEMIAELVQPFLERSTYDPGADNATLEEVLRSGGIGFAVAQILGLPANALGVTADVLQAYDTKAQERVINDNLRKMVTEGLESGRIDEATAANINAQVSDIRKGKGVLTQSEAKEETKVTGENLDKVYSDFDEAREAMKAEAKGMKNGETVRARVMKDGEVKTWETEVVNGSISPLVRESVLFGNEKVAYNEKAKLVASATNTAERTGYQLNVRDEIVKEVSALSKAFNREVEFYYDENSAVHGNVDLNTGKIYVNVNSSQSPAAAVIAHEMTHLLENTSSYKTLTNMMQKYYASSLEDKRNEIIAIYKSNPKAMKTILDENDKIKMDVIDSEVMAAFIEEKLLTDYNTIRELTRTDRTLAQKIVDWLNKVIQKITGSREQKFLIEARDVWNKALQENREYIAEDTAREVKERAPEVKANDRKFSIGRSEDAAYMDAVNRGDMETAQRMVDEAAKAAGYSNRMYHGAKGGGGFTVFRGWQYFTENKDYAERYADRNVPESLYSVYVKMEKPFDTRDNEAREIFYDMFNEYGLTELQEDGLPDWTDGYDITDYIEENDLDYDSVLLNEGGDPINGTRSDGLGGGEFVSRGTSYVIRDSAQIKSADPVTYDDDGNIIPLSQRFNQESDDIRWSIGRPTDTKAERKKQNRLDEATMREFDRLMKQRSEDERKDAEATMRMHDKLIKEVYNEAKALSAEEKREIRKNVKEEDKERMKKELASRAAKYRKERSNARKNLNEVLKEAEKQRKDYERKLAAPEKEAMRKKQKEVDAERRKERIRTAKDEYKRNAPKPAEGTTESLYFKNKNARNLITQFRRNVIGYLVEHGKFVETNGKVVLDENGVEIAYRNENDEWEISKHKNTYTPSWGLTLLAEKEGMDKDVFFTIYSKIADMKTKRDKNGNFVYKKKDITDYIISLNLNQKQKEFLYFDAAKFPYSKMPVFLPGGRVNEKAGNTRGRMMEALDNIAIDMFAGTMNDDYFESRQIREKDINAFVDAVFGNEESQERNDFALFLAGSIIDYSAQMETVRLQERTKLLTDKPKEKNSVKMQILRAYRESKRLFVAEGEAFERMGEKLKNPLITARYYGAKKSSAIANEMIYGKTQRDLKGEKQGKSLYEIFKPVFRADEKAGNNNNMKELTELVNCRHDIYRLRNGKGYTGYSIEECEKIVDRISREHPELLKVADEIAEYGRNLLRMCVESGRISEADFDYFTAKYPYYAPTFRLRSNEYIDRKGNVVRRDTKVIRTAVGGNDDVLPLFDQFVRRTQEIVKACKKNQLASELARSFTMPNSESYIKDVRKAEKQEDKEEAMANIGEVEDIGRARKEDGNENIIPWYSNGKKYDIEVSDEALLYGWDRITYRRNEYAIATALRKMNNIRRGVLTQYNPTFWLTNGIKDIHDMYLYNQHAQRLPKFHMEAAKTMFAGTFGKGKNEEALEEYLSFGMSQASIFEYDNTNSGRRTKRARVNEALRKPIDAFNGLNFMVEQTPRLAVYMETMDRLEKQRKNGGNTYTDEEIKTIAAYQASDATLNFGRGGTVVKAANTYGMTFLNAGVQGMDRFRRMFTQVKDGNKRAMIINICGLIMKLGIVGVGWNVLTDWIYGGDDEYAKAIREALYEDDADKIAQEYNEMADYQRTNYLLLNINGVWVRIPKGRLASFVYGFVYNGEKVYSGEIDALDLISAQMDLASETILFSNPITNNIFGPFFDVWRNKDAWDVEIVSEYEDMGEGFHYLESDEETTDLAIAIAEFGHYLTADLFGVESSRILDISPKKLDYLIEQYLGSYANVIMPFLSKEQNLKDNAIGALETMIKKFYIDPTSSNRLAGDYYDLKEEFENIANAHEGDSPYAVASKVFGDYTKELKALRDEINAIGADTSLSRKERLEQISELREQMNELYRQGILDAKDALGFAHANYYGKDGNSDLYEDWQKTSKGADWVVTTMSDTAQEQFALVEKDGVDAENFVNAYTFINNATADKDENGKSINGSKKEKIVNYLNSLDLTAEQKMSLYTNVAGYKVSDRAPAPSFVNGALIQPSTSNMAAPIAGGGRMTSGYGWRNCPFHGREFHQAVDIAAESGTDVGAVISGTVTMATVHGEYGNSIEITSTDENGNTVVTKYNHLLNMGVEVGDVINQGTKIGEVGSTGSSTGAHLDFRLKINNDWVDPTQYIDLESSGVVDATGYTQKEGSGGSASSGGYSGRSGGSSGGSDRKSSTASTPRTETKYDSVTKISGASSGVSSYSGGGVMLPTASEIAQINSRTVSGRSTKSATYGAKGSYLPKANSTPQHNLGTSVATTQRTGRTGGSMWDENLLS